MNYMQKIANKHNELFSNHKVTSIYSNDMTSGYVFDSINDSQHKVEQLDLQECMYEDDTNVLGWDEHTDEDKAYALNELITAQNEGI